MIDSLGCTIANLPPALPLDEGSDPEETGVVVLDPGRGAAARLGFERGDVVTQINDRDIPDVAAARSALGDARGGWRIRIQRGGRSLSMTLRG